MPSHKTEKIRKLQISEFFQKSGKKFFFQNSEDYVEKIEIIMDFIPSKILITFLKNEENVLLDSSFNWLFWRRRAIRSGTYWNALAPIWLMLFHAMDRVSILSDLVKPIKSLSLTVLILFRSIMATNRFGRSFSFICFIVSMLLSFNTNFSSFGSDLISTLLSLLEPRSSSFRLFRLENVFQSIDSNWLLARISCSRDSNPRKAPLKN